MTRSILEGILVQGSTCLWGSIALIPLIPTHFTGECHRALPSPSPFLPHPNVVLGRALGKEHSRDQFPRDLHITSAQTHSFNLGHIKCVPATHAPSRFLYLSPRTYLGKRRPIASTARPAFVRFYSPISDLHEQLDVKSTSLPKQETKNLFVHSLTRHTDLHPF